MTGQNGQNFAFYYIGLYTFIHKLKGAFCVQCHKLVFNKLNVMVSGASFAYNLILMSKVRVNAILRSLWTASLFTSQPFIFVHCGSKGRDHLKV